MSSASERELTVREAARRVHRAEETVRRWIWSGRLPARKVGRGYRVAEDDLATTAGIPSPRASGGAARSLAEWVEQVAEWRAVNGVAPRGDAGQLVVEDRAARAQR